MNNPPNAIPITILNVDDNAANRYVTTRMLEKAGFSLQEATTGQEALEGAAQQPALIVLDVNLPDMSGFDVCKIIKANPITASIPIVHLSASHVSLTSRVEGLEGGADAYLVRPVEPAELIATIHALLRARRAEDAARRRAQEWQTTFDALADAAALLDCEGTIQQGNRRLAELLGLSPELLPGHPFAQVLSQFIAWPDSPICSELFAPPYTRRTWERSNGETWYALTADPVLSEAGEPVGSVFLIADITARKNAEAALIEQRAAIETLNERLRRAMVETHHRVKNNLQIIAAIVDMQGNEGRDPNSIKDFRRITTQIRTLASVHDLLTEESKTSGDAPHISTAAVLEKLLPMMQSTAGERDIQFDIDDTPLPARQGTSLALLVNELVASALKHSRGHVKVAFFAANGMAHLTVSDDGPGFPSGFQPLVAANTGLELVDSLARYDLRGTVTYENAPEGGARVTVAFPL